MRMLAARDSYTRTAVLQLRLPIPPSPLNVLSHFGLTRKLSRHITGANHAVYLQPRPTAAQALHVHHGYLGLLSMRRAGT